MDIESRLSISFYKTIATVSDEHNIYIVQHIKTHKIYIKKTMSVYNKEIYNYLKNHHIPHTPRIYEIYEEEGTLTIIEEYISGDTIEQLLDSGISFDEGQIRKMLIQLCIIVSKFHNCSPSIIHRDIKPSNIIISPSGDLYLLDFNAAKFQNDENREDTVLLGTKGYAAPEQYGFGSSTIQTDIYSIGMLLNTIVNGSFSMNVHTNSIYSQVIQTCTQLNPSERYPNIDALLHTLEVNTVSKVEAKKWQRFLPPGFRELSPVSMIFSSIGYFFIFWICLSLQVKDSTPISLYIERIFCLLMFLSIIFCSANYLNIQRLFPPCRTQNKIMKILAVVLLDVLIFIAFIILMSAIVSFIS